jgi:hypothetical protein
MIVGLTSFAVRLLCPGTDTAVAADTAVKGATDAAAAGAADAGIAGGSALAADAAASALPEIVVSAAAPAAGSALAPALGAAGIGAGTALAAGSGGGGALPASSPASGASSSATAQSADPSQAADVSPTMLGATTPADISGIDSSTASMLGLDAGGGGGAPASLADSGTVFDPMFQEDPSMLEALTPTSDGGATLDQGGFLKWAENPKNALTLGMLGVSGMNALFPPKLPSAARQALGTAGGDVQTASTVINTGGTGSPSWPGMKANIDAQVDQFIQQQTESIKQAAANAGEQGPGVPTGVTSQQIASMTAQANTQREAMYQQALGQLVSEAVTELTGANSVLASIANMQMAEEQQARSSAGQTAELALLLQQLGG